MATGPLFLHGKLRNTPTSAGLGEELLVQRATDASRTNAARDECAKVRSCGTSSGIDESNVTCAGH